MQVNDRKHILLNKLAIVIKQLRGSKSQFMVASEYDISTSIISTIERSKKDPQYTTLYKLSEALGVKPSKLMAMIEDILPENFTMIDD